MGLSSLLHKRSKDGSESTELPNALSETAPIAKDHALPPTPTSQFILRTESETLGEAVSTSATPAAPLLTSLGAPLSSVPSDGQLQGIVSSGAKVMGKGDGGEETIVGQSSGVNPETVIMTTAPTTSKWLDKLGSTFGVTSSEKEDAGAVAALNTVIPPAVVDLSSVGIADDLEGEKARHRASEGAVQTLGVGEKVPTEIVSLVGSGSIADTIADSFSVSPNKSNETFHSLFGTLVAPDDTLIEDYRAALSREILLQGRVYVSEQILAFRSNILGYQTVVAIPFSEITEIRKTNVALIPSAITVVTPTGEHQFASFLKRDDAFQLIRAVWLHHHPEARSSSRRDSIDSQRQNTIGGASVLNYEDEEGHSKSFRFSKLLPEALKIQSLRSSHNNDNDAPVVVANESNHLTESQIIKKDHLASGDNAKLEAPGQHHPPTKYEGEELKNVVLDINLPTSPENVFKLIFEDEPFIREFWEGPSQLLKEIEIGAWSSPPRSREMSYIRPLNGSIGPKQTLCKISDHEKTKDENVSVVDTETRTPDVPSGNNFFTRTRTVITWSEGGGAHLRITSEVEWVKVNRLLRSIIESSCIAGQKEYHVELEKALRAHIAAHPEFLVEGASKIPVPVAPVEETTKVEQERGSILDSLMDPLVLLAGLSTLLLLTNIYTLFFHHGRSYRMGEPGEVVSAVQRALEEFSLAHAKRAGSGVGGNGEIEGIREMLAGMERDLREVSDRVGGLVL